MRVKVEALDLSGLPGYGSEAIGYQVEVNGEYVGEIEPVGDSFFLVKDDGLTVEEIRVGGFKPEWTPEQTARALQMVLNSSIGRKVLA